VDEREGWDREGYPPAREGCGGRGGGGRGRRRADRARKTLTVSTWHEALSNS